MVGEVEAFFLDKGFYLQQDFRRDRFDDQRGIKSFLRKIVDFTLGFLELRKANSIVQPVSDYVFKV